MALLLRDGADHDGPVTSLRPALEGASREQHQQHERKAFHHGSAISWIISTTLAISRASLVVEWQVLPAATAGATGTLAPMRSARAPARMAARAPKVSAARDRRFGREMNGHVVVQPNDASAELF